jgi:cation diffusion facilitator family transporter
MASSSKLVVYVALAANIAITVAKFIVGVASGSSGVIAEAIHSLIDTGNQALLLVGQKRSRNPASRQHPFGHGKELYFWSLIVAVVWFGVGGGMATYEGITRLLHPRPITNPVPIYVVMGIAALFEGISLSFALLTFKRRRGLDNFLSKVRGSKDPTIFTVLFEDAAALAGVAAATLGAFLSHRLRNPYYDGAASILIGAILCLVALWLARESRDLLIGESAHSGVVEGISRIVSQDGAVRTARYPLTMHLSPQEVLLNIEVEFKGDISAAEQTEAVERIERSIKKAHPEVTHIFIESRKLSPPVT